MPGLQTRDLVTPPGQILKSAFGQIGAWHALSALAAGYIAIPRASP
jgi:hypothetical protein